MRLYDNCYRCGVVAFRKPLNLLVIPYRIVGFIQVGIYMCTSYTAYMKQFFDRIHLKS